MLVSVHVAAGGQHWVPIWITLLFETGSVHEARTHQLADCLASKLLGSSCPHCPQARFTDARPHAWLWRRCRGSESGCSSLPSIDWAVSLTPLLLSLSNLFIDNFVHVITHSDYTHPHSLFNFLSLLQSLQFFFVLFCGPLSLTGAMNWSDGWSLVESTMGTQLTAVTSPFPESIGSQ